MTSGLVRYSWTVRPGRDGQAAVRADRHELLEERLGALLAGCRVVVGGHVVELPLELPGDRPDLDVRLGRRRVHLVERLPRQHEHEGDDDRRDHRPDDLGDRVAVRLGREVDVLRPAPIADDGPDDQPFDEEEDRHRDEEDDVVQVADLGALLGHRDRRIEALDDPGPGPGDRPATPPPTMMIPTSSRSPTSVIGERRAPGELDIRCPQRGDGHRDRAPRRCGVGGVGDPPTGRGHDTRSVGVSFVSAARFRRRRHRLVAGSCDDAAMRVRSSLARSIALVVAGRLAGGRGPGRGPRSGPDGAADARESAARLDVRAAADAGDRRGARLVVVGRPAGQRGTPGEPGPAPADRRVRRRPGRARRSPSCRASSSTTRRSSRSTWSSTSC